MTSKEFPVGTRVFLEGKKGQQILGTVTHVIPENNGTVSLAVLADEDVHRFDKKAQAVFYDPRFNNKPEVQPEQFTAHQKALR